MADVEILSEAPINAYQLKEELQASKTEDYLNSVLSVKDWKALFDKLQKMDVPRLRENHIHKIIDLLPETAQDVKVILQGYSVTVSQENMKKIAELVSSFTKK